MNTLIAAVRQAIEPSSSLETTQDSPIKPGTASHSLLHSVIEGLEDLIDGILIVTVQGQALYGNRYAQQICQQLRQLQSTATPDPAIPDPVWQVCQDLIESRDLFPGQFFVLEREVHLNPLTTIRIRVRWLDLSQVDCPCLMVMLEDRYQAVRSLAIAEAYQYGFTEREAEVWLLKRSQRTYKEIAAELHIAVDTVKKHLKNIYAKRDAAQTEA